jgi:hypothetical protein
MIDSGESWASAGARRHGLPFFSQHKEAKMPAELYREFEDALTEVLIENEYGLARRSRLFEARMRLKKHPDVADAQYRASVDRAFERYASGSRLHLPA